MLEIMEPKVIYEDNHLIGVNKPAGWLVQADITGDMTLADWTKAYIKHRYKKPGDVFLGVIHRIDRPVSGTVIFARTSKGLTRMNELIKERKIEKKYWAVTAIRPNPLSADLTHYILKDREKNKVKVFDQPSRRSKDAKQAELSYSLLSGIGDNYLLEVMLKTGRSHQIRAQLARVGYPIRGDIKYGFKKPNQDASIHLHCRSMSFLHPVKKEQVCIQSDPPNEQIWNLFEDMWG